MSAGWLRSNLIILAVTLQSSPAWAVQAHGGAEGLVSHQIGHALFAIGMGYLFFRLRSTQTQGRGWLDFKIFILLLVAWNIVTFTGHWMNAFVVDEKLLKIHSTDFSITIQNVREAIYYVTRLDHLILVPAFVFLLLALRKWRKSP